MKVYVIIPDCFYEGYIRPEFVFSSAALAAAFVKNKAAQDPLRSYGYEIYALEVRRTLEGSD
jgi:hypothetical protein